MSLIEWRDEYNTGISGVDYEHQQLIQQLNVLFDLVTDQAERARILEGLDEIYASIASHFALEEQTMQKYGYDQYQQHRQDHERLLDQIRDISDEFENSVSLDEEKFKQQLSDWFQNHFKTHDARLHTMMDQPAQTSESVTARQSVLSKLGKTLFGRNHE